MLSPTSGLWNKGPICVFWLYKGSILQPKHYPTPHNLILNSFLIECDLPKCIVSILCQSLVFKEWEREGMLFPKASSVGRSDTFQLFILFHFTYLFLFLTIFYLGGICWTWTNVRTIWLKNLLLSCPPAVTSTGVSFLRQQCIWLPATHNWPPEPLLLYLISFLRSRWSCRVFYRTNSH